MHLSVASSAPWCTEKVLNQKKEKARHAINDPDLGFKQSSIDAISCHYHLSWHVLTDVHFLYVICQEY